MESCTYALSNGQTVYKILRHQDDTRQNWFNLILQ